MNSGGVIKRARKEKALQRDRILQNRTAMQFAKQHTALDVPSGAVVAVKGTRNANSNSRFNNKKKTFMYLHERIPSDADRRTSVRASRIGSAGIVESVPISKVFTCA